MDDIAADALDVKPDTANVRGLRFFADEINATWIKGAADFIRCGQLLIDAKAELQTDAFNALVKSKLAFDRTVGTKLMAIAANPTICAQGHSLPPCWTSIYELSKLADDVLEAALADGTIHPGMKRSDAILLRKPKAPTGKPSKSAPELGTAWKSASIDQRRQFLDAIGANTLCEALSLVLRAELRRRVSSPQRAAASPLNETISKAFRQALSLQKLAKVKGELAPPVAAALNAINAKLHAAGMDLNNVTIALDPAMTKKNAA